MEELGINKISAQNARTSITENPEVEGQEETDLAEFDEKEQQKVIEDGDSETVEEMTKGDPCMFNGLCDRVLSSLSLVHGAVQEVLEFKDEMLKHDLPSPLLIHLALISGRVFRSIGELGVPVGELVRLVRIYSASWEENNTALRKLYESFESKKKQLNIAIRHLQLLDEQSKRMAREKRIRNWERLFAKVSTAKGHGRRWKFHIETIKEKARLGLEHVQAYALNISNSNEEEGVLKEDDEVSWDHVSTQGQNSQEDQKKDLESVKSEEADSLNNVEKIEVSELPAPGTAIQEPAILSLEKKIHCDEPRTEPAVARPAMRDNDTWTHEPEFDHSLFVRIFCPEGLQQSDLKCSLTYRRNVLKTPVLDQPGDETSEINQGSDRPQAARRSKDRSQHSAFPSTPESVSARRTRFCELEIPLPDEIREGVSLLGRKPPPDSETVNITVHQGKYEEIIATASINLKDIKQMSLETVYLPPAKEDLDVPVPHSRSNSFSIGSSWDGDSLTDSIDIPGLEDDLPVKATTISSHVKLTDSSEPRLFSLYSLHSGKSGDVQMPCGSLPLLMFWGKRPRPWYHNKQCGTCSVNDLVYALTGIDLTTASNEDLHKQTVDAAISVCSLHSEAEEEQVSRSEFDHMVQQHQTEIASLHQEYDMQVAELTELMNNLQAQQSDHPQGVETTTQKLHHVSRTPEMTTRHRTRTPTSGQKENSGSSPLEPCPLPVMTDGLQPGSRGEILTDVSPTSSASKYRPHPPKTQKSSKNFKVGHSLPRWGENLPHDFYERLRMWEEESKHHKQELNERTLKEIKENLERKLAGQNRLSKHEERIYDALQDVTLPALFMPYKMGNVYNPRAHHYFHPTGHTDVRLTQPPSAFQLPEVSNPKLSAVNLFQMSKNFQIQGPPWLLQRYNEHLQSPPQDDCLAKPVLPPKLMQASHSEQDSLTGFLDS